jgi:hypothetical protein
VTPVPPVTGRPDEAVSTVTGSGSDLRPEEPSEAVDRDARGGWRWQQSLVSMIARSTADESSE